MWRCYQISFYQRQKRLVGRLVLLVISCLTLLLTQREERLQWPGDRDGSAGGENVDLRPERALPLHSLHRRGKRGRWWKIDIDGRQNLDHRPHRRHDEFYQQQSSHLYHTGFHGGQGREQSGPWLNIIVDCEVQDVIFTIVYNPVLNQLWTAKKGQGAEYNGSKVSRERDILFVMLSWEISSTRCTCPPALSLTRRCWFKKWAQVHRRNLPWS